VGDCFDGAPFAPNVLADEEDDDELEVPAGLVTAEILGGAGFGSEDTAVLAGAAVEGFGIDEVGGFLLDDAADEDMLNKMFVHYYETITNQKWMNSNYLIVLKNLLETWEQPWVWIG